MEENKTGNQIQLELNLNLMMEDDRHHEILIIASNFGLMMVDVFLELPTIL
jgi:hypothetical protein